MGCNERVNKRPRDARARAYRRPVRLLLIRHAQTTANVAGAISTRAPGPDLTDLGREQAEALAVSLAESLAGATLDGPVLDGLYVSTLARTGATAAPLATVLGIPAVVLDGVHEIEAGDVEGRAGDDAMRAYLAPILRWREGDLGACIPGAFDGTHFFDRFDAAVARAAVEHGESSTVAIVSHAGSIKVWLEGRASNPAASVGSRLDNTGVVELEGSPSTGWRLVSWQGEPVVSH